MSPDSYEARLRAEGLQPSTWGNGPGDRYGEHAHDYDKVLVATSGSIVFHLTESGQDIELETGQRLEPAGPDASCRLSRRERCQLP